MAEFSVRIVGSSGLPSIGVNGFSRAKVCISGPPQHLNNPYGGQGSKGLARQANCAPGVVWHDHRLVGVPGKGYRCLICNATGWLDELGECNSGSTTAPTRSVDSFEGNFQQLLKRQKCEHKKQSAADRVSEKNAKAAASLVLRSIPTTTTHRDDLLPAWHGKI